MSTTPRKAERSSPRKPKRGREDEADVDEQAVENGAAMSEGRDDHHDDAASAAEWERSGTEGYGVIHSRPLDSVGGDNVPLSGRLELTSTGSSYVLASPIDLQVETGGVVLLEVWQAYKVLLGDRVPSDLDVTALGNCFVFTSKKCPEMCPEPVKKLSWDLITEGGRRYSLMRGSPRAAPFPPCLWSSADGDTLAGIIWILTEDNGDKISLETLQTVAESLAEKTGAVAVEYWDHDIHNPLKAYGLRLVGSDFDEDIDFYKALDEKSVIQAIGTGLKKRLRTSLRLRVTEYCCFCLRAPMEKGTQHSTKDCRLLRTVNAGREKVHLQPVEASVWGLSWVDKPIDLASNEVISGLLSQVKDLQARVQKLETEVDKKESGEAQLPAAVAGTEVVEAKAPSRQSKKRARQKAAKAAEAKSG